MGKVGKVLGRMTNGDLLCFLHSFLLDLESFGPKTLKDILFLILFFDLTNTFQCSE